ncbi:hypothetical protein Pfo_012484 [Paulownia fortunei]|nr:hypothetical protein Pfo_012484 [Paulownia fortunei]
MDNCNTANLQERKRCRLVLFPLPFQGHINPMIQLANILHSKGLYPHFTFHLVSDGLSETETSTSDPILLIKLLITTCVEPFHQCLAQLFSNDTNYHVECLVTDAIWYFTQAAADKFKLPRIVIRTTSVCSFLASSALPLLREKRCLSNMDSKMEAAILGLPPLKVKDIPTIETLNPEDVSEIGKLESKSKYSLLILSLSTFYIMQKSMAILAQPKSPSFDRIIKDESHSPHK